MFHCCEGESKLTGAVGTEQIGPNLTAKSGEMINWKNRERTIFFSTKGTSFNLF